MSEAQCVLDRSGKGDSNAANASSLLSGDTGGPSVAAASWEQAQQSSRTLYD